MARNPITQARNPASARTVLTYPRTPIGGVYIPGAKSIEGATGDTARTTNGWIEDEKYRWYLYLTATAGSAEFDTAVTRTGTKTVKLSNTDTSGRVSGLMLPAGTVANLLKYGIRVKPSTSYTLNCYVKTNNIAANSSFLTIREYNIAAATITDNLTNKLSGTVDWTLCTATFTTSATTVYVEAILRNNVAGNISDAWFDVNDLQLIETGVVRNPAT